MPESVDPLFPKCSPTIAKALRAHDCYVSQVERWNAWLERRKDNPLVWADYSTERRLGIGDDIKEEDKPLLLVLFKLIEDTIRRREPEGEWENVSDDIVPSVDDLKELVDYDSTSSKYNRFKAVVEHIRVSIEETALDLIEIIESTEFLTEINALTYDWQLHYANELIDQLSSSVNGLKHQIRSLNAAADQSFLPLFHPDRFLSKEEDFTSEDFEVMRRAGKVYAAYFLQLVPALMADFNISRFTIHTINLVSRYFPPAVIDGVVELEGLLLRVKDFHESQSTYLPEKFGCKVAGEILLVLEAANVYLTLSKLEEDPSVRNTFGMLRSLAELRLALSSAQIILDRGTSLMVARPLLMKLAVFMAIHDIAIAIIDTKKAWSEGDLSVASGHVIKGVGLAGSSAVAVYTVLAPVNPLVAALAALGALIVTLVGQLLIVYTQDPLIEIWFEHNYFGINWDDVENDEDPDSMFFRWKGGDKTNLARQISEYMSIFYPIQLELERPDYDDRVVRVKIAPSQASHKSYIYVKRTLDDTPSLEPIYMARRIDDPRDFVPMGTKHYSPVIQPGDEDEKLEWWSWVFVPPGNSDPTGQYLEVDVTIPDRLDPSLADVIEQDPEFAYHFFEKTPFILRSRKKIL